MAKKKRKSRKAKTAESQLAGGSVSLGRRAAERRSHRQTIYLNDNELAAVNLYCRKFNVRSRSALFRESVLMRIISVLDESQPTLF